jgi:branched-chain amino acid transport system substrate-binding protein
MGRSRWSQVLPAVAALGAGAVVLSACGSNSLKEGAGGSTAQPSAGAGSAKIALLVPQSGTYAPLGADMEQGFRFYLEQKNGKLGGKTVDLQVVDEGAGPETGVPAAQKLAQQSDLSAVVGIVNSGVALGVRDVFDQAKLPLVLANAGADAITGARKSDYVWRTSFSNSQVSAAMGSYVAEKTKGGSVYLIAPDYAAGKEFLSGFEKTFTAAGGKVAGQELPPFGKTSNYQPYLAKIKQSGATGVFAFFAGSEAVSFTKQYKELGLAGSIPLYSSGFLTEGGVLKASGAAAAGIESSLHYSDQLDTPRNKEFVQAYAAKYSEPPTVYAVQAYDAAQVLDKALEKGTTGDQVVEGLRGVGTVDSPRGPWTFDESHNPKQAFYLRKVQQGPGGTLVNAVVRELASP